MTDHIKRCFQLADGLHFTAIKERKPYIALIEIVIVEEEVDNFIEAHTPPVTTLPAPLVEEVVERQLVKNLQKLTANPRVFQRRPSIGKFLRHWGMSMGAARRAQCPQRVESRPEFLPQFSSSPRLRSTAEGRARG